MELSSFFFITPLKDRKTPNFFAEFKGPKSDRRCTIAERQARHGGATAARAIHKLRPVVVEDPETVYENNGYI